MGTSKSSKNYKKNPASRKKRVKAQAKINRRPEEKKRRASLNKERRKRGIYGKGGKDISHRKDGSVFLESPKKNRARKGKA
tara:strand:+ start:14648 stop:14890 length:243 start_codon:yes stop_codon:yes gene_type:complete